MASITRSGRGWRALVRRKGRKSISKSFPTKAAAAEWARRIEAEIDNGGPIATGKETVGDLIAGFRALRDVTRPIADTSNEHYILNRLDDMLGDKLAARLTVDDLVAFAIARKEEGAGGYTINMDISKLGTVLRYSGLPLPDVVGAARPKLDYLGLISGGGKRERRPSEDEMVALLGAMPQYADFLMVAMLTALRRSEMCRIHWADLDEDKRLVLVRGRKHPRRKPQDEWVPLLGEAWTIVQRQPRTDERIFPVEPGTVSKAFTKACRELGIPDLHLHDLRHEGVSRLFEAGYAIEEVALVSGHKKWEHLRRYTNLRPESLHEKEKGNA